MARVGGIYTTVNKTILRLNQPARLLLKIAPCPVDLGSIVTESTRVNIDSTDLLLVPIYISPF